MKQNNERNKRTQLVNELKELRKRENDLEEQIHEFDKEEVMAKLNKMLGKCFIDKEKYDEEFTELNELTEKRIDCYFLYGINFKNEEFKAIRVNYYTDTDDYFSIENSSFSLYFDNEKYKEITKEEFNSYYSEVKRKINLNL